MKTVKLLEANVPDLKGHVYTVRDLFDLQGQATNAVTVPGRYHADDSTINSQDHLTVETAALVATNVRIDGNALWADLEVTDNAEGLVLADLFEDDVDFFVRNLVGFVGNTTEILFANLISIDAIAR